MLVRNPWLTAWAGAVLCALLLALNTFRFPFLWDDFDFLGRAVSLRPRDFLPDPAIVFYRPLSREAYFWVVTHVLNMSPLAAHALNAAVAGGILAVLIASVRRMAGTTAGLLSGLVFACSAVLPLEIAWASASQDLLCALFVISACYLQLQKRTVASALAMAGALLSKETAIVALPAIIAISLTRADRSRVEIVRTVIAQGIVAIGWASIHPWTRSVLGGAASAAGASREYLAFRGTDLVPAISRGMAITLNIPWVAQGPKWPGHLLLPAIVTTAVILFLIFRWRPSEQDSDTPIEGGFRLAMVVGTLVLFGSLALTSLLLGLWSPHYACIPALGFSIVAGAALSRATIPVRAAVLLAYLWLGVGLRGNPLEPSVPSEHNFAETGASLKKVEAGLKSLYPVLPASNVYMSVQAQGSGGLYRQLFRFQPLRIWYRQPNIWVLDPNRRRQSSSKEYLFWIDPDLAVYEIRPTDFAPRGPTQDVSLPQYQKTLRGYSYGLASAGNVDRAVFILTNMPQTSRVLWSFDHRSAAMLLYAAGRPADAERVAATAQSFTPARSEEAVVALLAEPVSGLDLDLPAMMAFGLDPANVTTVRSLMRQFEAKGFSLAAGRFAARLQALQPGDLESAAVLDRVRKYRPQEITVAVPHDIPQ